ncbi:major facilitator superfamily domain-containing protein [Panaeolus papilionaceus]|nr:major facilitator superfamily domain-containing protein [Panaeolus papilionaceus]
MSTHSFTSDIKKEKDVSKDSSVSSVKIESGSSGYDAVFERRTLRYLDWRILPILALVYSFALIDRINLGAAYAAGMDVDLGLRFGSRYSIISCIYFVPYFFLQLPGNMVLRRYGVRNWLSFITLAWGAVQLGMGFVHSWGWLVLCRALLGVFEASYFPALVFIISTWYKRNEVQKRLAIFYLLSITAGGLSPLLAYVLSLLDGKGSLAGWRWIFVIEGIITILLAALTYFFIPEFPHQNRFLTKEQTDFVLKRIDEDRGDAMPDEISWSKVKVHLRDWTIWGYGVIFLLASLPSYAQGFFLPIILKGMGWSRTASLLLSVPPYGPTIITTMIMAHYADKYRHRSGFIAGCTLVCLIGLTLTAFAKQNAVRYFGCFLINAGNSGSGPSILAYSVNNVVSHSKRAVVTALTISLSAVGGVIATTIFRAADYPRYVPGLATAIVAQFLILVVLAVMTRHFYTQNKLSREGKLAEPLEGTPGFQYTL